MINNTRLSKFSPGQLYISQWIDGLLSKNTLTEIQLQTVLSRHLGGDWGDIGESDKKQNQLALKNSGRLISHYTVADIKVCIITDLGKRCTTILLSEENKEEANYAKGYFEKSSQAV